MIIKIVLCLWLLSFVASVILFQYHTKKATMIEDNQPFLNDELTVKHP